MPNNEAHNTRQQQSTAARAWRAVRVALALVGLAGVLAACSSSGGNPVAGVASVPSSASASASSSTSTKASSLAYSQCMRAHGIKDFPDPGSNGEIQMNANGPGSDLDFNNPRYQAADAACKSLLPPRQAPPANLKQMNLKYARCMRAHGISDFPDPKADGSLQVQAQPGGDLDPNNPQYKSADNACKKYLPDGGQGRSGSSGSVDG